MVNCPHCGKEVKSKTTKQWRYGNRDVKEYICNHCNRYFRLYISNNSQYTIPKKKK